MATTKRIAAAILFAILGGCGGDSGTLPVAGKVVLTGGDNAQLVGHLIEIASTADPTVRASGVIGPDGRFALGALVAGKAVPGALPGSYAARIVINDEGDGQTKKPKIAPKYLDFKKSGLTVTVPPAGDVVLTVSAR